MTRSDAGAPDGSGPAPTGAAVRFEPGPGPMAFGAIPWPDDLYMDAQGRVQVRDIPGAPGGGAFREALAAEMAALDGFGMAAPVYFFFDEALDPSSLPAQPGDSLAESASAFLLDVDTNSPEAFERVPVQVRWHPALGAVTLLPAHGHALFPGRRYAAVLTDSVRDATGLAIAASLRYAAVRDGSEGLMDPVDQRVRANHAPVLETLASGGLPRERIAGLAVFTVQSLGPDIADAVALVGASEPAPPTLTRTLAGSADLDLALGSSRLGTIGVSPEQGAPHDHLGWMIHGQFGAPNFLSAGGAAHGAFERDEAGALRVKRVGTVPFTLWLPMPSADVSQLPVVVFQHDMRGDRSDALALANQLAERGVAVVAMDAPYHGMRGVDVDTSNRFTGVAEPDAFGDAPGDFVGADDDLGSLPAGHPAYYRDSLRQGAVELVALLSMLQQGGFSALSAADPGLAGLAFDGERIGFVGVGTGATMGLMALRQVDFVGAAALVYAGGRSVESWADSPRRQPVLQALLGALGRPAEAFDLVDDPPALWPDLAIYQTLIDRAEAHGHGALLRRSPIDLVAFLARQDEAVHGRHVEELARTLGLSLLDEAPVFVHDLPVWPAVSGSVVRSNFAVAGGMATRVLLALSPAAHNSYREAEGVADFVHPLVAPYAAAVAPEAIPNPIEEVMGRTGLFFESRWGCAAAAGNADCVAHVIAP